MKRTRPLRHRRTARGSIPIIVHRAHERTALSGSQAAVEMISK